jgi:hypothetical protein
MTKQDEINILKEAAEKLGADSYLGAWLERAIPHLQQDIESDFYPLSYGKAEQVAQSRVQDAEKDACEIIASAVKEAENKRVRAESELAADIHQRKLAFKSRMKDLMADL